MKVRQIVQRVITPYWCVRLGTTEDYELLEAAFEAVGKWINFDFQEFAVGTYRPAIDEMMTFG